MKASRKFIIIFNHTFISSTFVMHTKSERKEEGRERRRERKGKRGESGEKREREGGRRRKEGEREREREGREGNIPYHLGMTITIIE